MLTALPIGFVLVIGMYLASRLRHARRDAAVAELPELARRLGLTHRPGHGAGQPGSLRGTFEGHEVFVALDDAPRVIVRFADGTGLDLRSYARHKRPPPGLRPVALGHKKLDAFFKDRYASEAVARRLAEDGSVQQRLERFRFAWQLRLGDLSITDSEIECRPDYGKPPHIPVGDIEPLLRELVEIAATVVALDAEGPPSSSD